MPLGDKLGRPFELLSLLGRKKKDDAGRGDDRGSRHQSTAAAQAYANATGAASTGYHGHGHSAAGGSSARTASGFYPAVKYERITTSTPAVQYERLTPGSTSAAPASAPTSHSFSSPLDYEAAAREAAFPSPDTVPATAVASSSFRSPALSSLPSPGMLTPLTPAPSGSTPSTASAAVTRSPSVDASLRPQRPPRGPPGAPFSSVMEEWMSQLRTPTPDVTLLPSPFDFNQDTPTPMDSTPDLRRLQDALLPTPPPDVHDQKQHPKTAAYVLSAASMARGQRPLLEDIASLCRDLNSQDLADHKAVARTYPDAMGYANLDGSVRADTSVLAAAATLSRAASSSPSAGSVSSSTYSSAGKGKRRKMCTTAGCQNLSRSRGLCKAHGGGRRCSVDGCSRASQSGSLCITHGGGKRCTVDGCVKAAQSRGMCKAHGGGVRCRVAGCTKSSQGDGFCRSHGGGRRCGHPSGCSKWAQRNGMCMAHSEGKYGNSYRGRQHRKQDDDDDDELQEQETY
ncbi:hypothetical protein BBJ28_00013169 [Nothophytophthora sp. Chile5]|nr:hypothetical protein BBJ28_00013169 [Nothophytophthora sp. Chile5]